MYRIPEIAQKYTEHDMIRAHTDLPDFPENRTRLLFAFLNKTNPSYDRNELYTLVTSLVQMGLDTHELVDEPIEASEQKETLSRQLRVLAGDYFSGRFYQLLSQGGHIEMIRQLSSAICEVNRIKMSLYVTMKQLKITAEEYIRHKVDIHSKLFTSFSVVMEGIYNKVWPDLLRGFTQCELIVKELDRTDSIDRYRGGWAFWHVMQKGNKEEKKHLSSEMMDVTKWRAICLKYNVRASLLKMLESTLDQVMYISKQLESETLKKELNRLAELYTSYLSAPKVLEEI